MSFNLAQTFYLDREQVAGAAEVGISAVELFFRGKPKSQHNKSGILEPGVSVFIAPTKEGVPIVNELSVIRPQEPTEHGARFLVKNETARVEWGEIKTSSDATIPTVFKFGNPVNLKTGQLYAIVIRYDGDEDFILWSAKQSDFLVGTATRFAGAAGEFQGKLFDFVSPTNTNHNPGAAGFGYNPDFQIEDPENPAAAQFDTNDVESQILAAQEYLQNAWKAVNDEDLMFSVHAARYSHRGIPVASNAAANAINSEQASIPVEVQSNNVYRVTAPSYSYEFFKFDRIGSNTNNLKFGDWYWQEAPAYPGGTATPLTVTINSGSANIVANASYLYANGTTFNNANGWNDVYPLEYSPEYIIVDSGANGVFLRQVTAILSNTVLVVDEAIPSTNTIAKIYKAPAGRLFHKSTGYTFGLIEEFATLSDTNANSTVRFVNNSITSVIISGGGSGYSNSDYLVISGYENVTGKVRGGYDYTANIVTDGSGVITAVYVSNSGAGFVNTAWLTGANVVVNNSSALPSVGTGATFTYTTGCNLLSEDSSANSRFSNCEFVNLPVSTIKPEITVNNPVGTGYTIKWGTKYYQSADPAVHSGTVLYKNDDSANTEQVVKIFKEHPVNDVTDAIIPSRSNEFVASYANGDVANATPYSTATYLTDSVYYAFDVSSNNDYTAVFVQPEITHSHLSKYIINFDYTNEHTNYGNAYARHIVSKVAFQEERLAEDLVVYLTAYKPVNTDIQVYVRIHNSADPDAFDDKDWTRLDQTDAVGAFSSSVDDTDLIEFTYGFPSYPNSDIIQTGTVTTVLNEANVNLNSGTYDGAIVANTIVKLYDPLFPNNYIIDVVETVHSTTNIQLRNNVANNNVVGSTIKLEKIGFEQQAFKYLSNNNVVRYYNEDKVLFTRYDTFQIKVILLGENDKKVPKIDDIRGIAVTA